jgi:hypothetical protein
MRKTRSNDSCAFGVRARSTFGVRGRSSALVVDEFRGTSTDVRGNARARHPPWPTGGNIGVFGNLIGNLGVQFAQLRPVNSRPIVVRGVVAKVAREEVVERLQHVGGSNKVGLGASRRVMRIRRPCRTKQGERGGQNKDEESSHRTVGDEGSNNANRNDAHHQKHSAVFGVASPNFPCPGICRGARDQGVLNLAHDGAVLTHPAGLVFFLIEIILVMPNGMVQHPRVATDPGLQRVQNFEGPVQDCDSEGGEMLMVMVERASRTLGKYSCGEIDKEPERALYGEVDDEIDYQNSSEDGDTRTICWVLENGSHDGDRITRYPTQTWPFSFPGKPQDASR